MSVIATFKTTKGTKTWKVSADKILDLDGFTTGYELNAESNTAVEGSPLSNQRGMKKKAVNFTTNLVDAVGVNVREEFESWEEFVGLSGVLKIGGKRFATNWLLTSVKLNSCQIDSSGRWRTAKLAFAFEESDDDSVDKAEEAAKAISAIKSAIDVKIAPAVAALKKPINKMLQLSQITAIGSSSIALGDVVQFKGGPHYVSSTATSYRASPKAGPAKVTAIARGARHPYHVIHTNGASTVYGWVDASQISK